MRNLYIKRHKSFAASLVKMQVYIEDHTVFDLYINEVPCRKLGDLANGQEVSFRINERAAKVFVIADTMSKEYCNDYYQLPEGEADIHLSGKNKFDPALGNAFLFDGNDRPDVQVHRKKNSKVGLIVIIVAAIIGGIGGFMGGLQGARNNANTEPQVFTCDELSVTLPGEFRQVELEGYDFTFESNYAAILMLKESFVEDEGFASYSLEDYRQLLLEVNELTDATLGNDGGYPYFEYDYTDAESGNQWHHVCYVYRSGEAFWMVDYALLGEARATHREQVSQWAKSVTFQR